MPLTAPDSALRTFLVAQAGLSLVAEGTAVVPVAGQNCFLGRVRPAGVGIPVDGVFVAVYGGTAPQPYLTASAYGSIWRSKVQVTVRRSPAAEAAGQALARSILLVAHTATITGYISCVAQQSEPIYLGPDGAGLHRWTLNFELMSKQDRE